MTDFSDIHSDISSLMEEIDGFGGSKPEIVKDPVKKDSLQEAMARVERRKQAANDYSYINNIAEDISNLNDSGFHNNNNVTLDPTVELTDRFISAIKRDESLEEITPLDEYTEARFAALSRQIMAVSNTVNTISENTIVSGIGHGSFGNSPGGGAARLVDQDDVLIDQNALVGGEVLVWDGHAWVPTFVSGVGGDVTSIKEGDGIDVQTTLAGGKGEVTISLDAILDDLNDVTIGTEASGQVIKYTGAGYENEYLRTNELNLTNPVRIVQVLERLNNPPDTVSTINNQEDANIFFADTIDSIDNQVGGNTLAINTLQGDVNQLESDLQALEGKVSDNASDITNLTATVAKKPDMTAQDTAPTVPQKDGQFWFDTNTNKLYVSNTQVWEEVSGDGGGASVIIAPNEPDASLYPDGTLWVDETTNNLYYLNNGIWVGIGDDVDNGLYIWLKTVIVRWADDSSNDTTDINLSKYIYVNWIVDVDGQPGSDATIINYIDLNGDGNYKETKDLTQQEKDDVGFVRDSMTSLTFDGVTRGGQGPTNYPDCKVKMHFFHDVDTDLEIFSGEYEIFKTPSLVNENQKEGDFNTDVNYNLYAENISTYAALVLENQDNLKDRVHVRGDGGIVTSVSPTGEIIIDGTNITSGKNLLGYISAVSDDLTTIEQNPVEGDYYEFNEAGDWLGDANDSVKIGDELQWDDVNSVWETHVTPTPTLDDVLNSGNSSTETIKVGGVQVLSDSITVDVQDFVNPNPNPLVVKFEEKDIRINGEKVTQRHILSDTEPATTDNDRGQLWIDSTNSKIYYLAEDPNDAQLNVWVEVPTGSGTVILSDTEPNTTDLEAGALWVHSVTDEMYYLDANGDWVSVHNNNLIISSTEPTSTDLKQGTLWVNDDYELFVLESDGGTWEQVGRDEYNISPVTTAAGSAAIMLREEVNPTPVDTFVEIVGDGDIEVKVENGQIVVDGTKLKGRVFLGYLDPTVDDDTSLDPNPVDNSYYEFNADGNWNGTDDVQAGDEIYWDGTQWVVLASTVATLDKVLKAGNESDEDFKVNKGTFESGIINLGTVDIEDTGNHLTYGSEIILTDKNIGLHELNTDKLDFKGNILEVTDTELLLNGLPIKGEGGGGGVLTHYLDDLYDVETFENTFEAIYNISLDVTDEGGIDTDEDTGEVTMNPVDENSVSSQDFYDNSSKGTRHYLWDDDRKMSGIGTVDTKSTDADGNFVFTYNEPDFLQKVAAVRNSFRISVADYTDLEDGSYLSWNQNDALWVSHKPTHPVTVSDTAPLDSVVEEGDLWFNTTNGNLYVRHKDTDSEQWVIAFTPIQPDMSDIELRLQALETSALSLVMSSTPPTSPAPKDGDLWVDERDMAMYIYETNQWVQLTTPVTTP